MCTFQWILHVAVYITFYFLQTLSGRSISKFQGHFSIIYDLCWSYNDKELLSASSDGTARYSISKISDGRVSLGVGLLLYPARASYDSVACPIYNVLLSFVSLFQELGSVKRR